MDGLDAIKQTFFQECEDLLRDLESGLMLLKSGDADSDTIDSIFRAVHSIKGGAGAFNLTNLVSFSHTFENVLDDMRSDRLEGNSDIYDLLLESSDMLHDLVAAAQEDEEWDEQTSQDLLNRLKVLSSKDEVTDEGAAPATEDDDFGFQPMTLDLGLGAPSGAAEPMEEPGYEISFRPFPEMFSKGHSVTRLIRHLEELGDVDVTCNEDELPVLAELDPNASYLSWSLHLASDVDEEEVDEVFDFVKDDCELTITKKGGPSLALDLPPVLSMEAALAAPSMPAPSMPAPPMPVAESSPELPAMMTSLSLDDLGPAPEEDMPAMAAAVAEVEVKDELDDMGDISDILGNSDPIAAPVSAELVKGKPAKPEAPKKVAPPAATKPAVKKPASAASAKKPSASQAPAATIRVNLERVDRLINQVGELVINQAMLTQCVTVAGLSRDPSVLSALDEFKQLTRNIQDSVMSIRAQPVQPLFQRMSRIVREAAQATQKKVRLNVEGELTEVDKTIIEKLADPLTHMIRNAVDHGLEKPDVREANGKNPEGIVTLSAAHRSGKIVIEIQDDGAGINREKVKQIAVSKGLIEADADLANSEIDNLLFMPGFSTVDQISTLSGRGVGMDVVKRSIQSFGGRITIASEPGKGSSFTINLPLTLAVLDGMLVEVTDQIILIPLTSIIETLLPRKEDVHRVSASEKVINVRGSFLPLIDLSDKLKFTRKEELKKDQVVICVETEDGKKCALRVDGIQDQRQVVIKSLEDNYGNVPYIAAATILGDGRIALIADIDELVHDQNFEMTVPAPAKTPEPAYV